MVNICLISLGCSKNLVDSEAILSLFNKEDFKLVIEPSRADCIIINTCGFILPAKKEGIDTILKMVSLNKKLIVIGCLVERYYDELVKEIPEVDLFVRFSDEYNKLPQILSQFFPNLRINSNFDINNRIVSTGNYSFFLKISEGCNRFCSFCSIPHIRGRFISYDPYKLISFCKERAKEGYKEVTLIGQDPTSYGTDLKDKNIDLVDLLKEIEKIEGIEFIRTLYLYPDGINEKYIDLVRNSKKIAHYFDIPIQHASSKILKNMNRKDTLESMYALFNKIKKEIPDAILRTTVIVGFPGETKEDIETLKSFIKDIGFNHLGVFTFSKEEGTKAATLSPQLKESTKNKRKDAIMSLQQQIAKEVNAKLMGREYRAIVVGVNKNKTYVRCDFNAPDEIDGDVIIDAKLSHKIGDIINIKITNSLIYDLKGVEI